MKASRRQFLKAMGMVGAIAEVWKPESKGSPALQQEGPGRAGRDHRGRAGYDSVQECGASAQARLIALEAGEVRVGDGAICRKSNEGQ